MAKRTVVIMEDTGIRSGTTHYLKDEIHTVEKELADRWIHLGWAKDHVTGEMGVRKPGVAKLRVRDVHQKVQ